MTGVLFTEQAIFPVYNMAATFPRWAYNAEIRLKAVLQTEFCRRSQSSVNGTVFGGSPMQISAILNDMAQNHFLLDGSYPHFYFLTLDHFGEIGTFQLCQPDVQEQLNEILSENLRPLSPQCQSNMTLWSRTGRQSCFRISAICQGCTGSAVR